MTGLEDHLPAAAGPATIHCRCDMKARDVPAYGAHLRTVLAATHTDPAAQAQAWFEGAQAATDWIKSGAWLAMMPDNPYADAAQAPATPGTELADRIDRLGALVREKREREGWSYRAITRATGVSHSVVHAVERGSDLRMTTAASLLEWLDAPPRA